MTAWRDLLGVVIGAVLGVWIMLFSPMTPWIHQQIYDAVERASPYYVPPNPELETRLAEHREACKINPPPKGCPGPPGLSH